MRYVVDGTQSTVSDCLDLLPLIKQSQTRNQTNQITPMISTAKPVLTISKASTEGPLSPCLASVVVSITLLGSFGAMGESPAIDAQSAPPIGQRRGFREVPKLVKANERTPAVTRKVLQQQRIRRDERPLLANPILEHAGTLLREGHAVKDFFPETIYALVGSLICHHVVG
ncbi:hypothetical protein [Rhodopseudomonas palustris]|uniref:hypothetical protein n=1 Tax=Rhodopseudomonas palustris TaxID=1076 RepID=UPI0015FF48FE|nr:hypothetical protein [Rhodopseudomonas palustris]